MKIDIYKPVVLFLLPAVLAGCSGEREPFPQGGKAGLRIENCSNRSGTDGNAGGTGAAEKHQQKVVVPPERMRSAAGSDCRVPSLPGQPAVSGTGR